MSGPRRLAAARLVAPLAVLGAAFGLALLAARAFSVLSFTEPMQVFTSGDEQSSLLAMWRHVRALPLYTDRFREPFANVGYNWLFYQSYGTFTDLLMRLLGLEEAWIPTLGRLFTLVGVLFAAAAAYVAFVRAARAEDGAGRLLCLAFAVFVVSGPLVGFWAVTVRPDLWAAVLEATGAALFLHLHPKRRWRALVAAAAFAYLAWAFKQSTVFLAGGAGLFLLVRRDWAGLAVLSAILAAAWAATLGAGHPQYLKNILFADYPLAFTMERLATNLWNFTVKSGPELFAVAAVALAAATSRARARALWREDGVVFALAGAFVAVLLTIPASAQTGASESYYFSLSFFLCLLAVAGIGALGRRRDAAAVLAATAAGWVSLMVAIVLVFAGLQGVIDVGGQHRRHSAAKRCLDTLPRPLFVNDRYLSLPWMTPGNTPYVLAYVYEVDRARGHAFENGGIGGMIEAGHFAAIAVWGAEAPAELDGARLDGYRVAPGTCPGMTVLRRWPGGRRD